MAFNFCQGLAAPETRRYCGQSNTRQALFAPTEEKRSREGKNKTQPETLIACLGVFKVFFFAKSASPALNWPQNHYVLISGAARPWQKLKAIARWGKDFPTSSKKRQVNDQKKLLRQ